MAISLSRRSMLVSARPDSGKKRRVAVEEFVAMAAVRSALSRLRLSLVVRVLFSAKPPMIGTKLQQKLPIYDAAIFLLMKIGRGKRKEEASSYSGRFVLKEITELLTMHV
jgi:hypothetical protein